MSTDPSLFHIINLDPTSPITKIFLCYPSDVWPIVLFFSFLHFHFFHFSFFFKSLFSCWTGWIDKVNDWTTRMYIPSVLPDLCNVT